jgi:hypothetical protein
MSSIHILTLIAQKHLSVETLRTGRDDLDFHACGSGHPQSTGSRFYGRCRVWASNTQSHRAGHCRNH